jgi:hypothetical protein
MGKKLQKFAKMRAFLAKIRKNVRFLTPFFNPPARIVRNEQFAVLSFEF